MATAATAFIAEQIEPGVFAGPVRRPVNQAITAKGSIHDDATAQKLGLRGGTVAGSIHLEQFPPLLAHVLGQRWYRTGSISLYFKYATRDREQVRAFARAPAAGADLARGDVQIPVWMRDERGEQVAEGTASVGVPDRDSALRRRIAATPEPGELRVFGDLPVGKDVAGIRAELPSQGLDARFDVITESVAAYRDPGLFGGRIATPAMLVRALGGIQEGFLEHGRNYGVRLFGAIELQYYRGPARVDRDYALRGRILTLGDTPKTEYYWYESILVDAETGRDVVGMLMQLRTMKASHPAWQTA